MQPFHYSLKSDYDKRVRMDGENILCYSASRLKSMHPTVDPKGCKEARSYSKSEKKPAKGGGPSRYEEKTLGEMSIGVKKVGISAPQSNMPFLYKKVGYVCLEDGSFVALCASRLPFFAILATLTTLLVVGVILLSSLLGSVEEPPALDHPLPPIDNNLVPDEGGSGGSGGGGGDGQGPIESPEGGGAVSMIYTLGAKITLSTGKINIHFKNPRTSNHSVVTELYIVSEGREYLVARSGLIPAGYGLYELNMSDNAPGLSEGTYEGMYRVMYYDPMTGIRANVQSDIADVVVAVKP